MRSLVQKLLFRVFGKQSFDKFIEGSVKSEAYGRFCERVYGENLRQLNMMDMEQLRALLRYVNIQSTDSVLDLGCGAGFITEFISDQSGAKLTGLDFTVSPLRAAQSRTESKRNRLSYRQGHLDALTTVAERFDVVLSIDSLYFARDLNRSVAQMRDLLKPGGRMGIFYTMDRRPKDPTEWLDGRKTSLARALDRAGLGFEALDFTRGELEVWRRASSVLTELETDFEREGNRKLFQARFEEAKVCLAKHEDGLVSRHLYLIRT